MKIGSRIKTGGSNQWPSWLPSQDSSDQSEASIQDTWLLWTNQKAASRYGCQWKAGFNFPWVLPPTFSCVYRDWFRKHWLKENLKHFPLYAAPCKGWALSGWSWWLSSGLWSQQWSPDSPDRSDSWFVMIRQVIFMISQPDLWSLRTRQGYLIWLALHCLAAQKNVLFIGLSIG